MGGLLRYLAIVAIVMFVLLSRDKLAEWFSGSDSRFTSHTDGMHMVRPPG
ncbi:hypothetical protein [Methylococcus capsulatus]|jgi:hypothetical protein|uniref:Uncharacterized protein n=1 Tax=Methylococcus capsulatus TaxID=414 RepID=A0AA35UFV6_METCP|nr:hypothetical protein [Methylococcus capsulatus]CAI8735719.1 protein of unknown function [Methylococcus capsulatus]